MPYSSLYFEEIGLSSKVLLRDIEVLSYLHKGLHLECEPEGCESMCYEHDNPQVRRKYSLENQPCYSITCDNSGVPRTTCEARHTSSMLHRVSCVRIIFCACSAHRPTFDSSIRNFFPWKSYSTQGLAQSTLVLQ